MADWNYIRQCVEALREHTKDNDCVSLDYTCYVKLMMRATVSPIPIFGGGDVYSSQAYLDCLEKYGVDGVMIGRGALIKPWLLCVVVVVLMPPSEEFNPNVQHRDKGAPRVGRQC
jgi:tRNA-dihydrouridine synthase 3